MAIYTYECQECGEKTDLIRKMKDMDKPVWCEDCGGQMQHVPEVPGRFIRGSGSWSTPA